MKSIRVVLVETTHPGNIGAAARAMANMGFARLVLINPKDFPSMQATARAAGADNILDNAVVCASLAEAVADCTHVFATSARLRSVAWPQYYPDQLGEHIGTLGDDEVAIVFGRESKGLTNQEMDLCHATVNIPVDAGHTSLNVASAVMVVLYEIHKTNAQHIDNPKKIGQKHFSPAASSAQLEAFHQQFDQTLKRINFYKGNATRVMRKIRRLIVKSQATREELNILQGVLTVFNENLDAPKAEAKESADE